MASNGRLDKDDLARAFDPSLTVYLAKDAAAGWNTFALYSATRKDWGTPAFNGPNSAYRTYQKQVEFWNAYQRGGNLAARPGTSNHGWGKAGDVNSAAQQALRSKGPEFGWRKIEAMSEPWHWNYVGGFNRPNPGVDRRYPILRKGSGGLGQNAWVGRAQRMLRELGYKVEVDGSFGDDTKRILSEFQDLHDLGADGVLGPKTWKFLQREAKND